MNSRCYKVVDLSLGPTGLVDPPSVDTILGGVGTSKGLTGEEGVQPGYKMRRNWSGQTAEQRWVEGLGVEVDLQVLSMIPARPGASGASGWIVPEMNVGRYGKTSTVSFGQLRIVGSH